MNGSDFIACAPALVSAYETFLYRVSHALDRPRAAMTREDWMEHVASLRISLAKAEEDAQ